MKLSDEQAAFLEDVVKLLQEAWRLGFKVTGGELQRPLEMQQLYLKTGRSKTMNSMHLKRCAIDLNFFQGDQLIQTKATLQPLGTFWESLNSKNRWGGNWNSFVDCPHFERSV